jgi:hypothetical protein
MNPDEGMLIEARAWGDTRTGLRYRSADVDRVADFLAGGE